MTAAIAQFQFPLLRNSLLVLNRQRGIKVNTRLLRWMTRYLLESLLDCEQYDLAVIVIGDPEMTRLNREHLRHGGTTDVITFDYNDPAQPKRICGEIFVSIGQAAAQARQFRTNWPSELARYVVHGVLHLSGYDDTSPARRRRMKTAEDRLVKQLDREFRTSKLAGASGKLPKR